MKKFIIHCLDKLDNYVIRHRWHWFCNRVANSNWWGEEKCSCSYCERFRK